MKKESQKQLELFLNTADLVSPAKGKRESLFFGYIQGHEKTILVVIAFIITSIVSFSLGVEWGKNLKIVTKLEPSISALPEQIREQKQIPLQPPLEETSKPLEAPKSRELEKVTEYTIQIASYKTKEYAQQEAERLKKKGFSPLIILKGNYIVLCVGKFPNRQAAESLLSELKKEKRYEDSIIRRL